MKSQHAQAQPLAARTTYRTLTALVGALLVGVGLYVLLFSEPAGLLRLVAGTAFVLLGANALYAAYRAKAPWLGWIGPLP